MLIAGLTWYWRSRSAIIRPALLAELTDLPLPVLATPTPSPTPFGRYTVPIIPARDHYAIFLVGDSMTDALGPHPSQLSLRMNQRYPEKSFIIDNYSLGAQNVLNLPGLLSKPTVIDQKEEPPALERRFDILIIESFGHNPLSQFSWEEGLKKQEEVLDSLMIELSNRHPQSVVIFLSTIAPSEKDYAKGTLDLPPGLRVDYARERRAYIENFIAYAVRHGIPLVNVYAKSLRDDESLITRYVRQNDYIHPSQEGVDFIQDQLADFIIEQNYLPY